MPHRRSSAQRHRRKPPRVKVVPYVVPTTRRAPGSSDAVDSADALGEKYHRNFSAAMVRDSDPDIFHRFHPRDDSPALWAGAEFWFFTLGAVLWLIAFFGLPRPVIIYVFGHELTHVLWVWLMGGRVSKFRVSGDGGHIVTNRTNFLIALAPYFFPLYSVLAIAVYGIASLFFNVAPYGQLLYAILGITWAFHLTFTCWMIPKNQTDLSDHGTFFSLVFIYLMNLVLLSALLVIASPQITFASFACRSGGEPPKFLRMGRRIAESVYGRPWRPLNCRTDRVAHACRSGERRLPANAAACRVLSAHAFAATRRRMRRRLAPGHGAMRRLAQSIVNTAKGSCDIASDNFNCEFSDANFAIAENIPQTRQTRWQITWVSCQDSPTGGKPTRDDNRGTITMIARSWWRLTKPIAQSANAPPKLIAS